jgi:ketosteroid isomerase-like protein
VSDTRELTPGDRRELRSLVKKQFDVLRRDVKRRKDELTGEIESELLRRYREQDERIAEARREVEIARRTYEDAVNLRALDPDLELWVGQQGHLSAHDPNRTQLHRALIASVPQQIADASTKLDQQELNLLRDLTIGALDTDVAQKFLSRIPTVGELVPKARLAELE